MPEDDDEQVARGPRALWSGTISFGLVSIPVELYPATRTERFSLRTLSPEGQPLRREFYCPAHGEVGEAVPGEHIVRGFKIEEGRYVIVTDDELEGLAPDKSRDIDLRRFVPRHEIPMASFERAHFMTPSADSNKAYRLLAKTLEDTQRVGIATFVMRGKEYLVAIIAEGGLLRAETLRFMDEVRTPRDIGLPEPVQPSAERVRALRRVCQTLRKDDIDPSELEDAGLQRARALVEEKRRREEDVIRPAAQDVNEGEGGAEIIDLFEVLKRSLQSAQDAAAGKEQPVAEDKPTGDDQPRAEKKFSAPRKGPHKAQPRKPSAATNGVGASSSESRVDDPATWTKKALYDLAQELNIAGRSQMSKPELVKAIRRTQSRGQAAQERKVG